MIKNSQYWPWLAAVLFGVAGQVSAQEALRVLSYGGVHGEANRAAIYDPFVRQSGVDLHTSRYPGDFTELVAGTGGADPAWDVADVTETDARQGCDAGLFEPVDIAALPPGTDGVLADQDFLPVARLDCAVAASVRALVVAWRLSPAHDRRPDSLADFFDTERFPGGRGMRHSPRGNLERALLAEGVPPGEVYAMLDTEVGVVRAFTQLARVRDSVHWWQTVSEPVALLRENAVVMTTGFHELFALAALQHDTHTGILWSGQLWELNLWAVRKGLPRESAAWRFVAFATDTQRQVDYARYLPYGPARSSALKYVSPALLDYLPTTEVNRVGALKIDARWWQKKGLRLRTRFAEWLAR